MTKSLEEIAQDTCEFEVGCTVCGSSKETRYTEHGGDISATTKTMNEQLDEIFETLNNKAREERASCTERNNWEGYTSAYKKLESDAKQAITSLIKEFVAEAKPAEKKQQLSSKIDNETMCRYFQYGGYNFAIGEFEQNLLKALEEV